MPSWWPWRSRPSFPRVVAADRVHPVDGGGVDLPARATRWASCCAWSHSIALPAGAELHQAELLRAPARVRAAGRWPRRSRASCYAWSRSITLPAGVELHQAELLQGLQRAELLPLALRLVDAAGVELVAVELLARATRRTPRSRQSIIAPGPVLSLVKTRGASVSKTG